MAKEYITPEGFRRLEEELDQLFRGERRKVTAEVAAAAALGDRSENAEYIYGKKRLREIDRRIRFLSKRLDELEIVDRPPEDRERVFFGAWVTVEEEGGDAERPRQQIYRIVGPDESDAGRGSISLGSPLGRALLGSRVGDEREVTLPKGRRVFSILAIRYESPE